MTDVREPSSAQSTVVATPAAETGGLESAAGTAAAEPRFPGLDGYRALAALGVVVVHAGFNTGRSLGGTGHSILARGDIGVPVFFVLSGFLLYRPNALAQLSGRPLPTFRDYLVRRALRIVPAYWLSVALAMLLVETNHAARQNVGQWLMHLFLVQIYSSHDHVVALEQDWSLCVEVSFYLLLPFWPRLLRLITRRRPQASVSAEFVGGALLVAVAYVWTVLCRGHGAPIISGDWLPAHLDWFACGMMLAVVSVLPATRPDIARRFQWLTEIADTPWTCWLGALAVFVVAITPAGGRDDLFLMPIWQAVTREMLFGVFAVLLLLPGLLGDQSRGLPRQVMRSRVMLTLGRMSYGIFVFHMAVQYLLFQWMDLGFFEGHFGEILGYSLAITIPMAYLSQRLVELPALRLKERWAPRVAWAPPVSASSG